ncbi:MAG TPA: D-glycerate dehydrogenase [Devosia sp.]|nr:D-glycerate dehydrogenase [Devosia sp.]
MNPELAKIFVTRRLPAQVETRMQMLFDACLNSDDIPLTSEQILKGARHADVIVSTISDKIDKSLIEQLPERVKLIAQFGNGVDNIDISAAHSRGITVTNTPSVVTEDTANMAMALILSLPRRIVEGARLVAKNGEWPGWSPTWMLGRRLTGKSLGIVGMGRIGEAVATRAKAVGLNIHYYSRTRRPPQIEEALEATHWAQLEDMLKEVDIVSLHTPHTKETFELLNRDRLQMMKRDAFVINVSRSELIDEDALIDLIEGGHLAGAALDVFEDRNGVNPGLLALARENKVVLTPHMASSTLEGRIEMGETVILNIKVFLDSHKPPHRVLG